MPRHYPGEVVYQNDSKFRPISLRNARSLILLGDDDNFAYLVHPEQTLGFAFHADDLESGSQHIVPVMSLALRDSGIGDWKQAHRLRIRKRYSASNVSTAWYHAYVERYGGIASDVDHLEGGRHLWKGFIRHALESGKFRVSLYDTARGKYLAENLDAEVPDEEIWSQDDSKRPVVIVLTRSGRT